MSQRQDIYQEIRNAITQGQLKPGERLVEKSLCETFNIGRTPLREALSQLQIEGYLDFIPNKGLTVTRMSIQNVKDIYHTIAILEGSATEKATGNLDAAGIKELHPIQNNLKKSYQLNDYNEWLKVNAIFHDYIIKASGNNCLHGIVSGLRNRIYRYRLIALTIPESLSKYFQAHEEILQAMSANDGKKAGRLMQKHVLGIANKLIHFLEQLPGL
jgi:DNA-binding GntR family transcriptional regulator